jgi:sortase A
MPPSSARAKVPVLSLIRLLFLVLGFGALGYVGFSLLDAKLFQTYENWRLNHAEKKPRHRSSAAEPAVAPASLSPRRNDQSTTVALGSVLGRLEIGRIGVAVIVVEGTNGRALRRAVGHIPGTALPGEQGNVALTGHRDTFFRALRDIRKDDEVTFTALNGAYRYRVDSVTVVAAEDTTVLNDSGEAILTLVTCYPFYFVGPAPKRFIVRAHRI